MTSTSIRLKCAFALILIAIASIGPIPIMSTLGAFVALFRPRWFKSLVDSIYGNRHQEPNAFHRADHELNNPGQDDCNISQVNRSSFKTRLLLFLAMFALMLIDIGPIPIASLIALFIVIYRPLWFLNLMRRIYQ